MLTTKLFIPPLRSKFIARSSLVARLNGGLERKLILVSAPAGFGKTTLLGEWLSGCALKAAWLSLDEGDGEPTRFYLYLIAALQTVVPGIGAGELAVLQSPQPPSIETVLTRLLNEIAAPGEEFILVLDDFHLVDSKAVTETLAFFLEHLSPRLHLVISTREDPPLPLAALRARGQLTELRALDLRFSLAESSGFLGQAMGLSLSPEEIGALVNRTEGWIAGLQLAALSMQGLSDTAHFVDSFTGSHRFVLDYLLEEVLRRQSGAIQSFLLRTSVLDRMCSSLCDSVVEAGGSQETLAFLERANLFIVPLDNERRWYRYHHLMADLLRQRLGQGGEAAELHRKASAWYEGNALESEAFHHAVEANDIDRAERLVESKGMPLHSRAMVTAILVWLETLPKPVLDGRPSLWAKKATLSLVIGRTAGVEDNLLAAETAMKGDASDDRTRNLIGVIAAARATLALTQYRIDAVITQSHRALEYLSTDNVPFRTTAVWTLGFAYEQSGRRDAAREAYTEVIALSQASGNIFFTILATQGLAQILEMENRLFPAAEAYRRSLQLFGDHPLPNAAESHLGLARILFEWNDLEGAVKHARTALGLAKQYDLVIDRFVVCELLLARVLLAGSGPEGGASLLAEVAQSVLRMGFSHRAGELAAVQVDYLLQQGDIPGAVRLAEKDGGPMTQARVALCRRDSGTALALLEPLRECAETNNFQDERLRVSVLQSVALQAQGESDRAVKLILEALALAEEGGFVRLFLDEGAPMAALLSKAASRGIMGSYISVLLSAIAAVFSSREKALMPPAAGSGGQLVEPLSARECEVLLLIAQGLSNTEIGERLFLALSTVKGHNQKIFAKLQAQNRTEAVSRARELGLL